MISPALTIIQDKLLDQLVVVTVISFLSEDLIYPLTNKATQWDCTLLRGVIKDGKLVVIDIDKATKLVWVVSFVLVLHMHLTVVFVLNNMSSHSMDSLLLSTFHFIIVVFQALNKWSAISTLIAVKHFLIVLNVAVWFYLIFIFFPVENEGTLKYLASVYANNHPKMHLGETGCSNNGQSMWFK